MTDTPLFELKGIGKRYGTTPVLSDINFAVARGESVALIGENGAGKSTFSKIVTGMIRPDTGEIWLDGTEVKFNSPRDAMSVGIGLIPQELAYVPHMSVAENILLGQWPGRFGFAPKSAGLRQAKAACERFGIDLGDLSRPMSTLKLADCQIVEIVKVLARNARLVVLDEPTASLSEKESADLFAILRGLNRDGVGVIYVSHRMDEVYRFSDRVTVLRNGSLIFTVPPAETTPTLLITAMLGKENAALIADDAPKHAAGAPVVELKGWTSSGQPPLDSIDLAVRRHEIVGIYGLRGCGADLIAEGLGGVKPQLQGELVLYGKQRPIFKTPLASRRAGIAFVPAERKRDGLVLQASILRNLTLLSLKRLSRFGLMNQKAERTQAAAAAAQYDVRFHGLKQRIDQLSGGNQQKILLASRLAVNPKLLVLQEPTRGVDVGARVQIHQFLRSVAEGDVGMVMVTSDLEEAVAVSHRLIVMREGKIVGELSGPSKTQAAAIALAAGEQI